MKLNLTKSLEPMRDEALARIDAAAEEMRAKFVTLGSGQAMVYEQKRQEAERFMADQSVAAEEMPHLSAEAALNDISLFDQAVEYLTMSQRWATASAAIEAKRLAAKIAVRTARKPADIAVGEAIDWSDVVSQI